VGDHQVGVSKILKLKEKAKKIEQSKTKNVQGIKNAMSY